MFGSTTSLHSASDPDSERHLISTSTTSRISNMIHHNVCKCMVVQIPENRSGKAHQANIIPSNMLHSHFRMNQAKHSSRIPMVPLRPTQVPLRTTPGHETDDMVRGPFSLRAFVAAVSPVSGIFRTSQRTRTYKFFKIRNELRVVAEQRSSC